MSHYDALGVPRGAGADAIVSAFRSVARRCHPDKQHLSASASGEGAKGDSAHEALSAEFLAAREALEVLSDPERRERYDRELDTAAARSLLPVWREVDLDDMEARDAPDGSGLWAYQCRCGGRYEITEDDLESGAVSQTKRAFCTCH
jgi:curved DNA-binding protein CbpA